MNTVNKINFQRQGVTDFGGGDINNDTNKGPRVALGIYIRSDVKQTPEEKLETYMKLPKEELIQLLFNNQTLLKEYMLEEQRTTKIAPEEKQKIDIPEELVQVCRDMAKVAQANGLLEFSGKFTPRHTGWNGDISFGWSAGRHGEDSGEIKVSSQFFVHTSVKGKII